MDKLRDPHMRHKFAIFLFFGSLVLWPLTHLFMLLTDPVENTWVFHVLLAISWFAITLTAMDIVATTDVRKEQDSDSEELENEIDEACGTCGRSG